MKKNFEIIEKKLNANDKIYYIKTNDMENGPYVKLEKFKNNNLYIALDENNDDTVVFDKAGKVVYLDYSHNYDRIKDEINNLLRIGQKPELIRKENFSSNLGLLQLDPIQQAILQVHENIFQVKTATAKRRGDNKKVYALRAWYDFESDILSQWLEDVKNMPKNLDTREIYKKIVENNNKEIKSKKSQAYKNRLENRKKVLSNNRIVTKEK